MEAMMEWLRREIGRGLTLAVLCCAFTLPVAAADDAAGRQVTFESADGLTLFGDVHALKDGKQAPIVLLFHQAGSAARGEYATIIPRLLEAGYNVFAIDQRSGGSRLGGTNRTVAKLEDASYGYCDAYPDLVAALDYVIAQGFEGPRFAWGSSYSAALVMRLGAERADDLAGVLAFSPAAGGPMAKCRPSLYAKDVQVPVLALRPANEAARTKEQLELFQSLEFETYVAKPGTHGSSMLNPDRVEGDVEPTWKTVMAFLASHASGDDK
jgi:alpha-beta hydrolase superfamily lysophospholipase